MDKLKIKVINKSNNQLPEYATIASAGLDLRTNIENDIILNSLERKLISTGIFMELPIGYEAQIRPRSGLAFKNGITVLNAPGTIDCDFRGEVKILLINLSNEPFTIKNGERVAQMVISKHEQIEFISAEELGNTERGSNGFGSTGK